MATAQLGLEKNVFALPSLPVTGDQVRESEPGNKSDSYTPDGAQLPGGKEYARQKWYQWFSPDDSPAERRLILKLDGLIMVFVFLAYWAKTLDSSATSTAYVSGMKEDLSLYGNQLNYLNTVYTYVSATLPPPACSRSGSALSSCRSRSPSS